MWFKRGTSYAWLEHGYCIYFNPVGEFRTAVDISVSWLLDCGWINCKDIHVPQKYLNYIKENIT